jgi:hypothetical protein
MRNKNVKIIKMMGSTKEDVGSKDQHEIPNKIISKENNNMSKKADEDGGGRSRSKKDKGIK